MKRTLPALILALLLASAVGCGGETTEPKNTETDTKAPETTEAVTEKELSEFDKLEKQDFGGAEFRIFVGDAIRNYEHSYIFAEVQDGDILNDTSLDLFGRVEEAMNVDIKVIPCTEGTGTEITSAARRTILADEDAYDFLQFQSSWDRMPSMIAEHCLYDLNDIPELSLDKPWYFGGFSENYEVNGQLYFAFSDFCNAGILPLHMVFNKKLMQEHDLELPYEIIKNGEWTFDKLLSYIADFSQDLDSNGTEDISDRYGFAAGALANYLVFGFDVTNVKRDDRGAYVPDLQNDKLVNAFEKIITFTKENKDVFHGTTITDSAGNHMFMLGQSLFAVTGTGSLKLRDIESFDFGVAPMPKWDASQKDYLSYFTPHQFGIPATVKDTKMVGCVTEALSILWHEEMTPVYIDLYTEQKILRDEESIEITHDMLAGGRVCDIARYYKFDDNVIPAILLTSISDTTSIVSTLVSKENAAKAKAETLFDMFFED